MEKIHLSKRLAHIAQLVEGPRIADVGTDHAYIPIALAEKGQIEYAVASDIGAGPCQIAQANVKEAGVDNIITVRQADGLAGIKPEDDIDTIVIAGMGGILITQILEAGLDRLDGTETLVLAPNRDVYAVRAFLAEHEFGILDEDLVEDMGHVYPLIEAGQTKPQVPYTDIDLLLGPVLRRKQSPLFKRELQHEINKAAIVVAGIQAGQESVPEKLAKAQKRLELLKAEAKKEQNDANRP